PPKFQANDRGIRNWRAADAATIDEFDASAFGTSRRRLLDTLGSGSRAALVLQQESDPVAGFGMIRNGSRALYLGPSSATSPSAGVRVIESLIERCGSEPIFWDIPDENAAAVECARQHGFTQQRPLLRMYLGENIAPGNPRTQFALAGPEVG